MADVNASKVRLENQVTIGHTRRKESLAHFLTIGATNLGTKILPYSARVIGGYGGTIYVFSDREFPHATSYPDTIHAKEIAKHLDNETYGHLTAARNPEACTEREWGIGIGKIDDVACVIAECAHGHELVKK